MSETSARPKPPNFLEIHDGNHPDKTAVILLERSLTFGESVAAFIVGRKGSPISEADIQAYCAERMQNHKIPAAIVFTDEIPRTPTGKILKKELREMLQKG